jgi:uncharacterized protein YecE (DUF72 family)
VRSHSPRRKAPSSAQLGLFVHDPALAHGAAQGSISTRGSISTHANPRAEQLAASLPAHVRFGTSSWTFAGWEGVLYTGTCSEANLKRGGAGGGLVAYTGNPLLRSVGLDRSYYAPVAAQVLASYTENLPADFKFACKLWCELTTWRFPNHPRYAAKAGTLNANFLAPHLAAELCAEFARGFGAHVGPLMFEFPPMPRSTLTETQLHMRLTQCLGPLARQYQLAVELRNRELLTPRFAACLRELGVAPVLNYWSAMPSIAEQRRTLGAFHTRHAVLRLLLPPGIQYADQKRDFAPFDQIVQAQPAMRAETLAVVEQAADEGVHELYVLVNNKAEGCAPITIQALAEQWVARDHAPRD